MLKIPVSQRHALKAGVFYLLRTCAWDVDGTVDVTVANGSVVKGFDVLVGADGIWSAVRSQMWGEPSTKPGTCTYSGKSS